MPAEKHIPALTILLDKIPDTQRSLRGGCTHLYRWATGGDIVFPPSTADLAAKVAAQAKALQDLADVPVITLPVQPAQEKVDDEESPLPGSEWSAAPYKGTLEWGAKCLEGVASTLRGHQPLPGVTSEKDLCDLLERWRDFIKGKLPEATAAAAEPDASDETKKLEKKLKKQLDLLIAAIARICCKTPTEPCGPDLGDARRKLEEAIRRKAIQIANAAPADLEKLAKELDHLKQARDATLPPRNPAIPDSDGLIQRLAERTCWDPCDPCQKPPPVAIIEGYPLDITCSCPPKCPPKTCVGCHSCSTKDRNKEMQAKYTRWFRLYYDLSMSTWVDIWEGQIVWTQRLGNGNDSRAQYRLWVVRPECLIIERARAIPAAQLF